jgi:hypothetical protein
VLPQRSSLHQLVSRTMNNEGNTVCRIVCWHSSLMIHGSCPQAHTAGGQKAKCPAHASLRSQPSCSLALSAPTPQKGERGHAAHPRLRLQGAACCCSTAHLWLMVPPPPRVLKPALPSRTLVRPLWGSHPNF